MSYSPVTHVIFDMDGLLINTEELYTKVTQAVLDEFNVKFTYDVKAKMMGRKPIEANQILVEAYGISDKISGEEFYKRLKPLFPKFFPQAELMPGKFILSYFLLTVIQVLKDLLTI